MGCVPYRFWGVPPQPHSGNPLQTLQALAQRCKARSYPNEQGLPETHAGGGSPCRSAQSPWLPRDYGQLIVFGETTTQSCGWLRRNACTPSARPVMPAAAPTTVTIVNSELVPPVGPGATVASIVVPSFTSTVRSVALTTAVPLRAITFSPRPWTATSYTPPAGPAAWMRTPLASITTGSALRFTTASAPRSSATVTWSPVRLIRAAVSAGRKT